MKAKQMASERTKRYIKLMKSPRAARLLFYLSSKEENQVIFELFKELLALADPKTDVLMKISLLKLLYTNLMQDPIYAWKALALANEFKLELPKWATSIVAGLAKDITELDTSNQGFRRNIGKALNMDGHSIRKIQKHDDLLNTYIEIAQKIEDNNFSKTNALDATSDEYGYSEKFLRDYFHALEPILGIESLPDPLSDF